MQSSPEQSQWFLKTPTEATLKSPDGEEIASLQIPDSSSHCGAILKNLTKDRPDQLGRGRSDGRSMMEKLDSLLSGKNLPPLVGEVRGAIDRALWVNGHSDYGDTGE